MKHKNHFIMLMATGLMVLFISPVFPQETFSIVAIDTITGEAGSAGASCLDSRHTAGGASIISDIHPGRGAIHTQALYHAVNQVNAGEKMEKGFSPGEIIEWLKKNDFAGNPKIRQYGIADLDSAGNPRTAAFTGSETEDYKNHLTGRNYAIQGNILLGQKILDSMEARFLRTRGPLEKKLMAALQGAKIPGADTRCKPEGVSSLSSFLRIAKPGNSKDSLYLDLIVDKTPRGMDPIDSLQILYDHWTTTGKKEDLPLYHRKVSPFPNPFSQHIEFRFSAPVTGKPYLLKITGPSGRTLKRFKVNKRKVRIRVGDLKPGLYFYSVLKENQSIQVGRLLKLPQ